MSILRNIIFCFYSHVIYYYFVIYFSLKPGAFDVAPAAVSFEWDQCLVLVGFEDAQNNTTIKQPGRCVVANMHMMENV